jgi:lysophospholipase L1-like esterase
MTVTASSVSRTLWQCLAADTKPTVNVSTNDMLFVTDAGQYFIARNDNNVVTWNPCNQIGFGSVNFPQLSLARPISIAGLGDSIVAGMMGSDQDMGFLAGINPPYVYSQYSSWLETSNKAYQANSWLTYASMRTDAAFYPFEYCYGYGGQGTVTVLNKILPILLANPYGLPDAVVIEIGTNDSPPGQNLTPAQCAANIKAICQVLMGAGIVPFLCQLLPRPDGTLTFTANVGGGTSGTLQSGGNLNGGLTLTSGTYPITFSTGEIRYGTSNGANPSVITWSPAINAGTVTQCNYANTYSQFVDNVNNYIGRIANELGIPHVPFFDRLTNGHGDWAKNHLSGQGTRWTVDGTHPQPPGAMVMGKVLAEVFQKWFPNARRNALPASIINTANTWAHQNSNFTQYLGTLNSPSSTPDITASGGWQFQPGQKQLGRIIDSAFSEAGIGHTMRKNYVGNPSDTPTYQGYAWNYFGDGVNQISCAGRTIAVTGRTCDANGKTITPGDRIAIAFLMKAVFDPSASNTGEVQIFIQTNTISRIGGYLTTGGAQVDTVQIGGEAGFESGLFYQEVTIPVGGAVIINYFYKLQNHAGASNVGDNCYLANATLINLTTGQILLP